MASARDAILPLFRAPKGSAGGGKGAAAMYRAGGGPPKFYVNIWEIDDQIKIKDHSPGATFSSFLDPKPFVGIDESPRKYVVALRRATRLYLSLCFAAGDLAPLVVGQRGVRHATGFSLTVDSADMVTSFCFSTVTLKPRTSNLKTQASTLKLSTCTRTHTRRTWTLKAQQVKSRTPLMPCLCLTAAPAYIADPRNKQSKSMADVRLLALGLAVRAVAAAVAKDERSVLPPLKEKETPGERIGGAGSGGDSGGRRISLAAAARSSGPGADVPRGGGSGGRARALELAYMMWVDYGLKGGGTVRGGGGWDGAIAEALAEVELEISLGDGGDGGEEDAVTCGKDEDAPPALIGGAFTTAMATAAPLCVSARTFELYALAHAAALGAEVRIKVQG